MPSAEMRISGPVLRDLLGLPADAVVDDVCVDVVHADIPERCDIEPVFTTVDGKPRLESWGVTPWPPQKPLTAFELACFKERLQDLVRRARMTSSIDRDYSATTSSGARITAKLPSRYGKAAQQ